ncbi:hypothetical protein ES319_D02G225000v1 [Gossypium barbadense]|uniref:BHLH domain-containing protein n=1 Tax=Gossypium barbadense TaxID=3634 RepID=A0A5J5SL23_GOSBA|nr:hypothetical protein ES319_D02G225000v1 [Gossypium barbadense]
MVLSSYYSNCETDVQNLNSEPTHQITKAVQADDHHEQQKQHLQYYCDPPFELPLTFLDPCIDLNNNFLHPENYYSAPLLPYDPLITPYDNFSSYPCPKRHKLIEDHCLMPGFFDGVALNSCPQSMNGVYSLEGTHTVGNCKKISDEKCVSVQSIAARERRRKITKKTQELGKLVPGGTKMNTAEMLQAAFKYVKYLQAQLGILQLMNSFPENKEGNRKDKESMQIVTSSKVQEKLYIEEKCLVPKDFVLSLTTLSRPPLSDELTRLLSSSP